MTEEAASLHRQLGKLSLVSGADSGGAACESTSTSAAAATADVQGQLAALTSKLDQLALCLGGLQLQQQAQQGVHQLPTGSQAEAASEAGVTYVCWDTNVWMDQLKLIRCVPAFGQTFAPQPCHSRCLASAACSINPFPAALLRRECWKRLAGSSATGLRFLLPLVRLSRLQCGSRGCRALPEASRLQICRCWAAATASVTSAHLVSSPSTAGCGAGAGRPEALPLPRLVGPQGGSQAGRDAGPPCVEGAEVRGSAVPGCELARVTRWRLPAILQPLHFAPLPVTTCPSRPCVFHCFYCGCSAILQGGRAVPRPDAPQRRRNPGRAAAI